MLDLTHVKAEERRTAETVDRLQRHWWKHNTGPKTSVTVPQSFLLESLASLVSRPIRVERVGWRGRKTRLTGDSDAIKGVLCMFITMVLGSERSA